MPGQLPLAEVLARLKPWLESEAHAKLGQNLKYDAHVLANHGIALRGIAHDTLLQSYVLESDKPHDMDSLALRYLGYNTIKFEDVAGKGAKQIPFSQVGIDEASRYAAEDADVTLRLHHALQPQLLAEPALRFTAAQMKGQVWLLNPGGALSFITSNKWFRAKYGTALREYMVTHTELRQIIDFGDEAVFDALAYPTIVIATKRGQPVAAVQAKNNVLVLNWDSQNPDYRISDFPDVFADQRFAVPQCELKPGGWQLEPPRKRDLLARLRKAGQPLARFRHYGFKMSAGQRG